MKHENTLYVLSLLLCLLLLIANGTGLLRPEVMYAKESANWYAQSFGQDIINLALVFLSLLISSIFIFRRNGKALFVWAGILVYIIYTFIIYCFAVHFNSLFLVYCMILGLAFYLFVWFLLTQYNNRNIQWPEKRILLHVTGIYMIVIAGVFYSLWLMQIIPASMKGTVPAETANAGLFTNPVHVLDLSIVLPGMMMTGILLLKRHQLGFLFTPVVLTFFVLMDLTIGSLMLILRWKGFPVNDMIIGGMLILAIFSAGLLISYLRAVRIPGRSSRES